MSGGGDDSDVSLHSADPDPEASSRAADSDATSASGADPTATAATPVEPAIVDSVDEYTIFDYTPTQIQAHLAALNARSSSLSEDEKYELAQLECWEANRRYRKCLVDADGDTYNKDVMDAGANLNKCNDKAKRTLPAGRKIWDYSKDYTTAKTKKIADIESILNSKLNATSLSDTDQAELVDETKKHLTDQDYTLASMQLFLNGVGALDPSKITDKAVAQQQLQALRVGLVLRAPAAGTPAATPPVKPKTPPKAHVKTNTVNPFVLKSQGVMAQTAEAFIKTWMMWFNAIWNTLSAWRSKKSAAAPVTPPAKSATPPAAPVTPPAAPPASRTFQQTRYDTLLKNYRDAAIAENVERKRRGKDPVDLDMPIHMRTHHGIPIDYKIEDWKGQPVAAAAPAAAGTTLTPVPPLPSSAPASASSSPNIKSSSRFQFPTWPTRQDMSSLNLRNAAGLVGGPLTAMYAAMKRSGVSFKALRGEQRTEIGVSVAPKPEV